MILTYLTRVDMLSSCLVNMLFQLQFYIFLSCFVLSEMQYKFSFARSALSGVPCPYQVMGFSYMRWELIDVYISVICRDVVM